jgi:hypothetical protein
MIDDDFIKQFNLLDEIDRKICYFILNEKQVKEMNKILKIKNAGSKIRVIYLKLRVRRESLIRKMVENGFVK